MANTSLAEPPTFITGWHSDPDGRGTIDIIWSCFFTIFVCTWTVLNLNVPGPQDTYWVVVLRKFRWMLVAVLLPKVLTASAFAQHAAARNSVRVMEALELPWSMCHAFYLEMGAVWLKPVDDKPFPINAAQLSHLVADGYMRMPSITKDEIWDKSKADRFAKLLACGQIGWLLIQCVARAIQHLPITPLEIATLGFTIPSFATFALWFSKPVDIQIPMTIELEDKLEDLLKKLGPQASCSWRDTPLDFIGPVNSPSFVSEVILKNRIWPGHARFTGPADRIRNDVFGLKYSKTDQLFVAATWVSYAAVHLIAYDFSFPSHAEVIIWRVSAIAMAGSMVLIWMVGNRKTFLLVGYLWPSKRKEMEKISNERGKVSRVQILSGAAIALMYMSARVCLIVLALIALRQVHAAVYNSVEWTGLFPHS